MVRLIDTLINSDTANTDRSYHLFLLPFLFSFLLPPTLTSPLTSASLTCHASLELNGYPTPVKTCYRLLPFPKGCMSSWCLPSPLISTDSHTLLHSYTQGNDDQSLCLSRRTAPHLLLLLLLSRQAGWLWGQSAYANEIVSILKWVTENQSALSFHTLWHGFIRCSIAFFSNSELFNQSISLDGLRSYPKIF